MHTREWRWNNFPLPQPHMIVGTVGIGLSIAWPLAPGMGASWAVMGGLILIGFGVAIMIRATTAAGRTALANPDRLVTDGPYSRSRHPMYLAWTMVYLGVAGVFSSVWLLLLLPILVIWVQSAAVREETRMVERFGAEYREYQTHVRRYL